MAAPHQPGTRISWTPRQREVLDLLAQGLTNGQIAERLDITLDGAKFHVSEILNKLGATSREEAAAYWLANRPTPTRRLLAALTATATLRYPAIALGALTIVGLATLLILAAQDDSTPSTPDATSTATHPATTTPTTSPTEAPTPTRPTLEGPLQIVDAPGAVQHLSLPPGEPVSANGVYFLDVATGAIEVWISGQQPGAFWRSVSARWALFESFHDAWLADRDTGRVVTWKNADQLLVAANQDYLIFERSGRDNFDRPAGSGRFQILRADFTPVASVDIGASQDFDRTALFSPDGSTVVLTSTDYDPEAERNTFSLHFIDLASGRLLATWLQPPLLAGERGANNHVVAPPATNLLFVTTTTFAVEDGTAHPPRQLLSRLAWTGAQVGPTAEVLPATWLASISPDGRYALVPQHPRQEEPCGEGCVRWGTVSLVGLESGRVLFRVDGAQLTPLGTADNTWLADSSGFFVTVGARPGQLHRGEPALFEFVLISLSGEVRQRLPFATSLLVDAVYTSPDDPAGVALGSSRYYGLSTGRRVEAAMPAEVWPHNVPPWTDRAGELRFFLPVFGRGAALPVLLPEPRISDPASPVRFEFTPARTDGHCLLVRAAPEIGSPVDCVQPGVVLTLAEGSVGEYHPDWYPFPRAAVGGDHFHTWIRVRTPSGAEGWVRSDYLDWAP